MPNIIDNAAAGDKQSWTVTLMDSPILPVVSGAFTLENFSLGNEIVFISGDLPDLQTLLDGVKAGSEVHILDAESDELAQMAGILAGRTGFDAIHILSHGSAGQVQLGTTTLTSENLADYSSLLARIGSSLTVNGDLLLYGCDVAAGDPGKAFLHELAVATGADVAASTDPTGAASLGGDWGLEVQSGLVEATAIQMMNYNSILDTDSQLPSSLYSNTWNGYTFQTRYDGYLSTSDPVNTLRSGCYWDRYVLSGVTDGTIVRLYMGNSSTVDDFLQIDRNGSLVTQDDDQGDGERSYDSFLSWTYQSGDVIRATTYSSGNTGSYTLWIGTSSGVAPVPTDIGSQPAPPPPINYAPDFTSGTGNVGSISDTTANDSFSNLVGYVTATDTRDTTSDTVSYSLPSGGSGSYGYLSIGSSNGYWTFTPYNSAIQGLTGNTTESFTVRASDGVNITDSSITFYLYGANDPIVAYNDTAAAWEARGIGNTIAGTNPTGNIFSNDSDPDSGDSKTIITTTGTLSGTYGSLYLGTDGSYTYTVNQSAADFLKSGESRTDTFSYTVKDSANNQSSATLTVTINGYNDTPTAVADTRTVVETGAIAGDSPVSGNVLSNDTDADTGETATLTVNPFTLAGSYGTLTLNANGTYSYALNNAFAAVEALRTSANTLTDTFTYTVKDTNNVTNTANLTITIQGSNDAPVVLDETGYAIEASGTLNHLAGQRATGNVLINDSDVDSVSYGETMAVSAVRTGGTEDLGTDAGAASGNVFTSQGAYGILTLNINGLYSYTIAEGNATVQALKNGVVTSDSFNYSVRDTAGVLTVGVLSITITGRNDAPVISAITSSDGRFANRTISLTDTVGPDSFNAVTGALTVSDPENDALTYDIRGGATSGSTATLEGLYGTLTVTVASGAWSYTPNATAINALNASTSETFQVRATDNGSGTLSGLETLTIAITAANDTPLTSGIATQTWSGSGWTFQVPSTAFTDAEGLGMSYAATKADGSALPTWLSFNATTRTFSVTGTPDTHSSISLKVTATDPGDDGVGPHIGTPVSTTFMLDLSNGAPTSSNDALTMQQSTARLLNLTDFGNYADAEGTPLAKVKITSLETAGSLEYKNASNSWVAVTAYQEITATDITAGKLRFTPTGTATGEPYTTIGFQVSDGILYSHAHYTLTLNVSATYDPHPGSNDAPSSTNDSVNVALATPRLLGLSDFGNYADPEGDALASITITTLGAGTLERSNGTTWTTVSANDTITAADITLGRLRYTPAGAEGSSETIGFEVSDGLLNSTPSTLTVNIIGTPSPDGNDAPGSTNDSVTIPEDAIRVLTVNDFGTYLDPNGDALAGIKITTLESVGSLEWKNGSDAWVAVTQDQVITVADLVAGRLKYVPVADANGTPYATIGFKVGDGALFSDFAYTLTLNVTPVNDAPTGPTTGVLSIAATPTEDTSFTISKAELLAGFANAADGQTATLSVAGLSADAALVRDNGDNTYTIIPRLNFNGVLSLSYSVVDADGFSIATTRTVAVASVNDAPALTSARTSLPGGTEDTDYTVTALNLLRGFSDVDGTPAIKGDSVTADHGTVSYSNGTYTVHPTLNYNGPVTLSYMVNDGSADVATTHTFTLAAVNDAPTLLAAELDQNATSGSPFTYTVPVGTFGDVDSGDTLSYTAKLVNSSDVLVDTGTLPVWLHFDAQTRQFSGTPANGDAGTMYVRVTATDNAAIPLSASEVIAITIPSGNINHAPALTGTPATLAAGTEDHTSLISTADLLQGYTDADGDTLTITSLSVDHGTLSDVDASGLYTFTPDANYNGTVTLTCTVNDSHSGLLADQTHSFSLAAVNDTPTGTVSVSSSLPSGAQVAAAVVAAGATTSYTVALKAPGSNIVVYTAKASGDVTDETYANVKGAGTFGGTAVVTKIHDGAPASSTSSTYNFDTDQTSSFTPSTDGTGALTWGTASGIVGSGGGTISSLSDVIWATNAEYSLAAAGTYTVSALFHIGSDVSGYFGVGFSSSAINSAVPWFALPGNVDYLGINSSGGGYVVKNGVQIQSYVSSAWPDSWYKLKFVVTSTGTSDFTWSVSITYVDHTGAELYSSVTDGESAISASFLAGNNTVHAYFSSDSGRVDAVDNFMVTQVLAHPEIFEVAYDSGTSANSSTLLFENVTVTVDGVGVGSVLTANTTGIADSDTFSELSYQWYANGAEISLATNSTYTLQSGDVGKAVNVVVSYLDGGGTTEH
ncbi:MAG: tandem-95 repeat protein, partial [Chlorobium sp.]|nr:tandem-95 repeat protein [Chlorobium sp.]